MTGAARFLLLLTPRATVAPSTLLQNIQFAFNLQEASNADALDAVNAYVAAQNGGPIGTAAGPGAGIPAARSLSGITQFFTVASNADFQFPASGSSTFALWFYNTISGSECLFGKYGGTLNEYLMNLNALTPSWNAYVGANANTLTWGTALSLNTWYALRCGYDAVQGKAFLQVGNGTMIYSGAIAAPNRSDSPFDIARFNTVGRYFVGRLAALMKWSRLLTDAEWTDWQNGGGGKVYPF